MTRKAIIPIISAIMALSILTACGNSGNTDTRSDSDGAAPAVTVADANGGQTNETANPDFRNVCWNMTIDEVKSSETAELDHEEENGLTYVNVDVINYKAQLDYVFSDGRLNKGIYYIDVTDRQDYEANNDFFKIHDALCEKYGDPEKTSLIIMNGEDYYSTKVTFTEFDGFSFDDWIMNDAPIIPTYTIAWKTGSTDIRLSMDFDHDFNHDNTQWSAKRIRIMYSVDMLSASYDNGL